MGALILTLIGIFCISGSLLMFFVAVRQFTTHDAVSRVNALGPATALGLPLIVVGTMIGGFYLDGFSWDILLKSIVTIIAAVFVSSVATSVLARAAYMSGAPLDPHTDPNDLANVPTSPNRIPHHPEAFSRVGSVRHQRQRDA